jgi:hypothetical protein
LVADTRQTLIAVVDDATKQLLYAQLVAGGESLAAILTALRTVVEQHGIPGALYTDRAGWAVYTPTSGTAPDRTKRTQVGRALARLGIEHIVSFSPQARGRSERANGTLQGRLVNELHLADLTTVAAANAYLTERFIADYNDEFARPPADPTSVFVPLHGVELDRIPREPAPGLNAAAGTGQRRRNGDRQLHRIVQSVSGNWGQNLPTPVTSSR